MIMKLLKLIMENLAYSVLAFCSICSIFFIIFALICFVEWSSEPLVTFLEIGKLKHLRFMAIAAVLIGVLGGIMFKKPPK